MMNEYTLRRHVGNLIGQPVQSWGPAPTAVLAIVDAVKRRGLDLPTEAESDAEISAGVAVALHPEHGRVQGWTGWHRHEKREHIERLTAAGHHAEVTRLMSSASPASMGPMIGEVNDPPERWRRLDDYGRPMPRRMP